MKKNRLYTSVLITILLASCTEAGEMSAPGTTDSEYPAIRFNPVVSSASVDQTRTLTGTDGTGYFPTGDHNIGIYMMKPNTSTVHTFDWEGLPTPADQYNNVRATLNVNRNADPIHKWTQFVRHNGTTLTPANRMTFGHASASTGALADFYAYYPHVATTETGQPVSVDAIPFTLSTTSNITDILYARYNELSYDTDVINANPVEFKFQHALSLISFTVINQGKEDVIVSGGGVADLPDLPDAPRHFVYTECTMDLSRAVLLDGVWKCPVIPRNPGTRSTVLATNVTVPKNGGICTDIVNITLPYVEHNVELLQPDIQVYLTISYANSSTDGFATSYGRLKVPKTPISNRYGWMQGYKYNYEITITSTGIFFGNVKIAEWVDAVTQPGAII